jgi:hypothetical protein
MISIAAVDRTRKLLIQGAKIAELQARVHRYDTSLNHDYLQRAKRLREEARAIQFGYIQ